MKKCRTCSRTVTLDLYYYYFRKDGSRAYRADCKQCMNARYNEKYRTSNIISKEYPDVVHDYKFSRFIGRGHENTLAWLDQGYSQVDMERLRQWRLRQYENTLWMADTNV